MQMKGPKHEKDIPEKYLRPARVEAEPEVETKEGQS